MSNEKPILSIIVISYNTRDLTLACLTSVYAETRTPFELIVLDNASTDGSAEAIAREFPDVILIAEKHNHGFGPAHKFAMERVSTDWILLLNPDTVVLDGAIDALMAFAERTPEAGIWGGRTVYGDGSLNPTSCFARMTLGSVIFRTLGLNGIFRGSSLFNSEYYGDWQRDCEREVDIVTGCLLLVRRETWSRLDGFDDAFAMYGEEVDFCLRARKIGLRPRVTPDATIVHYGGASQDVRVDKMIRLLRAKMELISRHFSPASRQLGLITFQLWPLTRYVALGMAGRILRNREMIEKSRLWADLWRRRDEWRAGYGGVAQTSQSSARPARFN